MAGRPSSHVGPGSAISPVRGEPVLTRVIAIVLFVAAATIAAAVGVANQANFNDGRPGSPMQCRTFEDDPQGTKCADFCRGLKAADREGSTYCMCLPGPCPKQS